MEYTLTLPKGEIKVRNNIFSGSHTEAVWAPCNPKDLGGWQDGDRLHVICAFNLNPPIDPQPPSSRYAGLCAGACSTEDRPKIRELVRMALGLPLPNPGILLDSEISMSSSAGPGDIFYNAQSESQTFQLRPSSRGELRDYIYKWHMTYNGNNEVVPDGNSVEIVFGYGDPMETEVES